METFALSTYNNLPNILNENELQSYFFKLQNGDKSARNIIVTHNIKLVLFRIDKIFKSVIYGKYEKSDLVNIGIIGLIKAIESYNLDKKIKFTTYASICIDNEIIMFLRKEKKYYNVDSLDRNLSNNGDSDDDFTIGSFLKSNYEDGFDKICKEECNIVIREFISKLNDRDRRVIELYFGFYNDKCYTQVEIANMFNISQSYLSRILRNVLKDIKSELIRKGIIEARNIKQR